MYGVAVDTVPILRQQLRHASEDVRGQMLHFDKGQDQISGIVSEKADVLAPGFRRPSDEAVSRAEMTWGGRPGQAGNRSSQSIHEILQMFSDRLCIAKVVISVEQAVEKRFLPRMPDEAKLKRPDCRQTALQQSRVHKRWDRFPAIHPAPG